MYEFLQTTPEFCELLLARASEPTLLNAARTHGMKTLREECLALVTTGHTTLEEVLRVTGGTSGRADRNRRGKHRAEDSLEPMEGEDDGSST